MGVYRPEVCVIGSGPAGLAVALRAGTKGKTVLLAESGHSAANLSALNKGHVTSAFRAADRSDPALVAGPSLYTRNYLQTSRIRRPGGCSNSWSVRARKNSPATLRVAHPERCDFEAHSTYDIPAWPLPYEIIDRYLDDSAVFFDLNKPEFSPDSPGYGLDEQVFKPRYFHFSKASTIYGRRLGEAAEAEGIELRTGWTLVDIKTNAAKSRIVELTFIDAAGQKRSCNPGTVVLAAGGIENSRILLNAARTQSLADPHDVLGRWFMDHPHARLGVLVPKHGVADAGGFHDFQERSGRNVLGHYALTGAAARCEDLLRFSMTLVGHPRTAISRAANAGATIVNSIRSLRFPDNLVRNLAHLASDPRSATQYGRSKLRSSPRHHTALGGWSSPETAVTEAEVLAVESMVGQRPSPDNRIRLARRKDRFGQFQACLQWSWSEPEVHSYWRSVEIARTAFTQAGAGEFIGAERLGAGAIPRAGTGWHHMGGTRMSEDPRSGAVDPDCRHHQVDNLYLAGSSVFPSAVGYNNPTLTVAALALRLGDHLATI